MSPNQVKNALRGLGADLDVTWMGTPSPQGVGSGIDWGSIVNTSVAGTLDILKARYANIYPQGTSIQTPNGSIFRAQEGVPLTLQSLPIGSTSLTTWLLIGGALVVGLAVLKGRG